MESGKLRHQIELQSATETLDSYRQPIFTWATYATVWADVRGLYGVEGEFADSIQAKTSFQVDLRYNSSITTDTRIKWGSRYMQVVSVIDPEGRKRRLRLLCVEATDGR